MGRKEAIEIVRKLYNESLFLKKDKEAMVILIPELKESEDERIRKELLNYLKSKYENPNAIEYDYGKWIAWLEKHGEQKPAWSEEDEKIFRSLSKALTRISSNTRTDSTSINYSFFTEIEWLKSLKERFDSI